MSRYLDPDARFLMSRTVVRMPYLPDSLNSRDPWPHVTNRSPIRMRRIAEQLCAQFDRETDMQVGYRAATPPGGHVTVVLLPSTWYLIGRARLIAGAVGVSTNFTEGPGATWVYVHPNERGRGLIQQAWPHIAGTWPGVQLVGPFTKAGAALRDRLAGNAS
ncbi:hypothetical protein [Planomonospora sp. ID82291]|uniref:hypothetical protein n=1 Tax=Planomonospora sp. ID82291 TaxID=2738136 RepID=UPI0018C40C08|nr:hypothetical protein [Planomonospora sp. ID82291]MBG0818328.1 hypothetical protein [Planomonospora sp. ID82291]